MSGSVLKIYGFIVILSILKKVQEKMNVLFAKSLFATLLSVSYYTSKLEIFLKSSQEIKYLGNESMLFYYVKIYQSLAVNTPY